MNNKIIFLDIDGVLNYRYFYQSKSYQRNVKKNGYDMVNQICKRNLFWLSLLCRLTKSKVVLSSTWKYGWEEDGSVRKDIKGYCMIKTDSLFRENGINIISVTRRGKLSLINFDDFLHKKYGEYENQGKSMKDIFGEFFGDKVEQAKYYFGLENEL